MKHSVKIFVVAMCILLAAGLICIGVGIVLGGDFGAVVSDILMDLYARLQGTAVMAPVQ